ncbi:MAG: pyridoxal phosphate-dependent aminotransferase [Dethiobacteria bacterium]
MVRDRLEGFELPPQWSTMREAARLELEKGKRIIHMEKGDYGSPEFKMPRESLEAMDTLLKRQGYVRYSPGAGLWSLREALAEEMAGRGRATMPEEIVVTPGAKFAIAATFLLFLEKGDEVIMPDPGYPPDEFWARYMQAEIKYYTFRDPRQVDTEQLEKLITPRTKLVIINTPQRPNGQLIENLEEIAAVLSKYPQIVVVSDEIFSKIVYHPCQHRSISMYPDLHDRTIVIDTFSKSYVMTGLRIGWLTAPVNLAKKYDILLQNSCTNVSTIIQEAALAALQVPPDYSENLLANLRRKRDLAFNILSGCKQLQVDNAQGSFYLFPKLPEGLTDQGAVDELLKYGIAVVPGSAFGPGGAGHIRLTFSLEDDILAEGVRELTKIIEGIAG